MAIGDVNAGYMGYLLVNGNKIRFQDGSLAARQEVMIPDSIMGHYDHNQYVYGPITIDGSISGPVTERFDTDIWPWAVNRKLAGDCGKLTSNTVDIFYYCGNGGGPGDTNGRRFGGMYVNSINFSVTAGDIANFSMDLLGAGPASNISWLPYGSSYDTVEKLITWDKVSVSITHDTTFVAPTKIAFQSFDFTVANNIETVYGIASDQQDLFPYDVVPGLRTITGSFTAFNIPKAEGADAWDDYATSLPGQLDFSIGDLSVSLKVKFHRVEPVSSSGVVTSTIAFSGVGPQDDLDA